MRFGIAAVACVVMASQAGAVTFTGTLDPVDGFAEFNFEDVVGALGAPSLKSFTFSITNGVIAEANIYAYYRFAYDDYDENGYETGNDYWDYETCSFNSSGPEGCWNTFIPGEYEYQSTWMKDLSVGQRSLTFNVNQPRTFNECTDPPAVGRCSYYWDGDISPQIKIASYRPVNFTWTSTTFGGAVPEPASWAMMIAGFGLMGSTLRRRPRYAAS